MLDGHTGRRVLPVGRRAPGRRGLVIQVSIDSVVAPLAMAGLAMASVGLWTLRVALAARGRKWAGAIVAAAEALAFALAFTQLASDLDAPDRVVAYAVGVAGGTLLGLILDERLSGGRSELRIVVPGPQPSLVRALHDGGWSATSLRADGPEGPVTLLFVTADERGVPALVGTVRRIVPRASWTVHRLSAVQGPRHGPGADQPDSIPPQPPELARCSRSHPAGVVVRTS